MNLFPTGSSRTLRPLILAGVAVLAATFWIPSDREPVAKHDVKKPTQQTAPAPVTDASASTLASSEKQADRTNEPQVQLPSPHKEATDPFQSWAEQFAKSTPDQKAALRAEGMTLARARRTTFAQLIQQDPKQAVETALPYHLRKALPPEIASQIEYPVSGRGEYWVYGVLPPAGVATVDEPVKREVILNGQNYSAYTYGKKLGMISREKTAILGVGITLPDGKKRLAVREENYVVLDPDEARDRFEKSAPKNAICPVSNAVIAPTNSDIAVDTGGDELIWMCKGGHIQAWLETPDGQRIVSGDMADSGDAAAPPPPKGDGNVMSPAWTHGPKRFLAMNVAFSNQYPAYPPHSSAVLETSMQEVMAAFVKSSYGKMQPSYAVTPVLTLPGTDEFYLNNDYQMLLDARVVAANYVDGNGQHPYDTEDFDFDCVVFKSSYSHGYGGLGGVGAKRAWSTMTTAYVFAHEWGHNLGLWHASKWIASTGSPIGDGEIEDYGDIWDVMGTSYNSNLVYNSFSRRRLGWLGETELPLITTSGTYRIYDSEAPLLTGGRLYGFRAGGNAHIYHVEFRPREVGRDQFMDNGVLVRWTGEWQAQLLEMSLLTKLYSNVLLTGRTFSDFQPGVHITPLSTGVDGIEQYIDVAVSFDTITTNSAPVGVITGNTEVNPNEDLLLTATGIDPDGDTLSYWWNFGDGTCSTNGLATQTKKWSNSGTFQVACFISDRRGGSTVRTMSVRVGAPATGRSSVSGRVTNEQGLPIEGAIVTSYYNTFYAFTDSDGYYFIGGVYEGGISAQTKGATEKTFTTPPAATGINFTVPWTLPSQSHSNLVSVDAASASVKEGETASYTLTRSGSTAAALDVYFNLLGTASAGQDFVFSGNKATIPAGSASVVIPVPVSLDQQLDPGETLVVSLKSGVAYGLGGRPRASVLIHDAAIKDGSGLLHEWWTGLTGTTVSDLLISPAYPDAPTGRELWAKSFQMETATTDIAHRFRGTFTSPVSGLHYFYISSDDSSELWFGNDHTPKSRRKIAYVNGTTNFQEWGKFPEQRSVAISIPAGQPFYIEVLCKQGGGTQHLSVGVEYPNGSMERPISIQRLNLPSSETLPGGAWTTNDIGNTPGFGTHGIDQQPLTVAPALRYRFDGPAGTSIADGTSIPEMGGGPSATLRGAGATWAANGSGLDLPGGSSNTQAYIDLPNGALTDNRTYRSASYELWYVQQSHQSNSHVFDFGSLYDFVNDESLEITAPGGTFSPSYGTVISLSGNVGVTASQRFQQYQYGAPMNRVTENTALLNQLTHMVILYSETDRNWRWYRNGVLIDTIPELYNNGVYSMNDINNWLGRSATSTDSNADALYREFRVYDYALTDAQVRGSFLAGPDKVNLPDPFQFSQRATNYPFWISGSGSLADGATNDSFHLVSQQLSGDGEVRAKIGSLQQAGANSVLGVMLRGNTTANSPFGFLGWAGDGSIRWMTRKASGAQVVQSIHTIPVRPQWLKVCRAGNVLTAYVAADLTHWDQIGESVLINGLPVQALAGSAIADGVAARVNEVLTPALVFDLGTSWKYIRPVGNAAPVGWNTSAFNDASWSSGNGLIGFEGGNPNLPISPGIQTTTFAPTASQNVTFFRKSFQYTAGNPANARVAIDHAIDDGVTYYLNGKLLGSVRHVPGNALASPATGYAGDVNGVELEAVVVASDSGLVDGTNVLCAELHQISAPNSDMVFGVRLKITPGSAGIAALGRIDELVVSSGFTNGKGIAVESYNSLSAGTLASLTSNAAYPDSPAQRSIQNGLLEVTPGTNHYGQRLRGVFTAPATGNHTFYIAGGSEAQLYLGTSSSSTSRQLIATISSPTANRAWGTNAAQHSAPIPLVAGTRYYLDVVRAGSSATPRDISVGVMLPDGTPEFPMLGGRLEPYLPLGPFDLWSDSRFGANAGNPTIAGEDADPDGDGLTNWAEYGLMRNPLQADPGNILVPKPQGGQLVVTYQRPAGQTDILYIPEWSDNLVDWFDTSITQTVVSNDGDVETVEVHAPATAGGKRFVKITLEQQ